MCRFLKNSKGGTPIKLLLDSRKNPSMSSASSLNFLINETQLTTLMNMEQLFARYSRLVPNEFVIPRNYHLGSMDNVHKLDYFSFIN